MINPFEGGSINYLCNDVEHTNLGVFLVQVVMWYYATAKSAVEMDRERLFGGVGGQMGDDVTSVEGLTAGIAVEVLMMG